MTTEATERDLITEVEELLANPKVFARSWYEGKQARELLRRLVDEVKRVTKERDEADQVLKGFNVHRR